MVNPILAVSSTGVSIMVIGGVPVVLAGAFNAGYVAGEALNLGGDVQAFVNVAEKEAENYAFLKWKNLSITEKKELIPSYEGGAEDSLDYISARTEYSNAFEHGYVSARMVQSGASYLAELLGNAREFIDHRNDSGIIQDTYKDFWNNRAGRVLAENNPQMSKEELLDSIHNSLFRPEANGTPATTQFVGDQNNAPNFVPDDFVAQQAKILAQALRAAGSAANWLEEEGAAFKEWLAKEAEIFSEKVTALSPHLQPAINGFVATPLNPEPWSALADPIAVDLNRDGVIGTVGSETLFAFVRDGQRTYSEEREVGTAVYFDIDNDGMKEAVSWLTPDDGWLARDVNGNGTIDNASELFGGMDPVTNEPVNGFGRMALLDDNGDGRLTAADAAFAQLLVWQDRNSDGVSQSDELLSVQDDLFFTSIPVTDSPPGSNVNEATSAAGNIRTENITLSADQINTVYGGDAVLDFGTAALPELRGYGNVPNLSIAMSLDDGLKTMAQDMAQHTLAEIARDFGALLPQFDTLLYRWAGPRVCAGKRVSARASRVRYKRPPPFMHQNAALRHAARLQSKYTTEVL